VVARAPLIAVGRGGVAVPPGSTLTGVTMPEISATRIRELLRARDPEAGQLLPRSVLRYIADHHLYSP
jgi:nicotinic acid mononucleotide adenylyltransferase